MKLYFVSFFMYPLVKNKIKKNQTYSDSVAGQKVSHLIMSFQGSVHKPLSPPVNQFTPEETPDKRHQ